MQFRAVRLADLASTWTGFSIGMALAECLGLDGRVILSIVRGGVWWCRSIAFFNLVYL